MSDRLQISVILSGLSMLYGDELGGMVETARLADEGLLSLRAPVKRVAGFDTVMPLPRLESLFMPSEARILDAARETMAFA